MEYSHRYHAYPTQEVAEGLEHQLDVHRQLYNHVRWDYTNSPEDDKPSAYDQNNKLPEWKRKWPDTACFQRVSASRVIETGSPCLKEPPTAASRQG